MRVIDKNEGPDRYKPNALIPARDLRTVFREAGIPETIFAECLKTQLLKMENQK